MLKSKKNLSQAIIPALLFLLFLHTAAMAQSGPARSQLEQFSQDLQTLQASFDQLVMGTDGSVEDESAGRLWLSRPQLFRWEYGGDFPELLVADGEHVWIYDEMLEQVTVKDQSRLSSDSPLTLLTDLSRLDEQFEVRELGDDNGMQLLELKARRQDAEFERVLLGLRGQTLVLMAMEDAFGLRTEIRFRDIERNPPLDRDLFRFDPPPDTDVLGDYPGVSREP
jgi:outer membrane lipoprotein carrier protein